MTLSPAMKASDSASEPSFSTMEFSESDNLQPFHVLHKASPRNSQRKGAARRIDLSPLKPVDAVKSDSHKDFQCVWSKIHSTIKGVLRNVNINVFNEIHSWVQKSFLEVKSSGVPTLTQATRSYPILTNSTCNQIYTGLVLIKNMEFVDDLLTFEELGLCLKSHGCHVANMSSADFSTKNGVAGSLRSLLRQFLMVTLDTADISLLASWYREKGDSNSPIVVIIDDMERCSQTVISDFILMLNEWVVKIPVILILGVTTLDAPRSVLPSHVLQKLSPTKFELGSPAERMDAVVEAALVRWCSGFSIGHKVVVFLRNYFLNHDGTLTAFIRALKIACAQHIFTEPLSFILASLAEDDSEVEELSLSPEVASQIDDKVTRGLTELKRSQQCWSTVVMCLYEAGKHNKVQLLDLFCEALDPEFYKSLVSENQTRPGKGFEISSSSDNLMDRQNLRKGGPIYQAILRVRDLPPPLLSQLINRWENISVDVLEILDKVKELQQTMNSEEGRNMKDFKDIAKRQASRSPANVKVSKTTNERAVTLITTLFRDFMKPIECVPFHEIICFKDVEKLQLALIGDPRRRIQVDLLEFQKFLKCNCCIKSCNIASQSMPDASILYTLAQEHGDLINLHDWFESFKSIVTNSSVKPKRKGKQSPMPKKKDAKGHDSKSEALIQAQFCRAVTELQMTGLIRMPSKRRPDFVQRVAFGL